MSFSKCATFPSPSRLEAAGFCFHLTASHLISCVDKSIIALTLKRKTIGMKPRHSLCTFVSTINNDSATKLRNECHGFMSCCLPFQSEGNYAFNQHNGMQFRYMWPCITKPTKSRMTQFCVMARNRWSGSAWVIFRFWYILLLLAYETCCYTTSRRCRSKEQSFFYSNPGSIKRIISRVVCCFSRPIFLWSDGSCDHSTCPIISLWTWLSTLLWTLISFQRSKLEHWHLKVVMNRMYSISVQTFRIIW